MQGKSFNELANLENEQMQSAHKLEAMSSSLDSTFSKGVCYIQE